MQSTNIFDFDCTISIKHTFKTNKIEKTSYDDAYKLGKQHANNNTKTGIDQYFKHDDNQNTSAIATYHNNPQFIAGYVAHILNRELRLDSIIESDHSPKTSINKYIIEGMDKPFYISYIPNTGTAFKQKIEELKNKNKQITDLRHILLKENMIEETSKINFYDDTHINYFDAMNFDFINSYSVSNTSKIFERRLQRKFNSNLFQDNIEQNNIANYQEEPITEPKKIHDNSFMLFSHPNVFNFRDEMDAILGMQKEMVIGADNHLNMAS